MKKPSNLKKKLILLLLILAVLFFTNFVYEKSLDDEKLHEKNIQQISVNMTLEQVLSIMGQPNWIHAQSETETPFELIYNTTSGDHIPINIEFDSNLKVSTVELPYDR